MYSAAAPATYGEAMLVPLSNLYEPSRHVELIFEPGAIRSTLEPKIL